MHAQTRRCESDDFMSGDRSDAPCDRRAPTYYKKTTPADLPSGNNERASRPVETELYGIEAAREQ